MRVSSNFYENTKVHQFKEDVLRYPKESKFFFSDRWDPLLICLRIVGLYSIERNAIGQYEVKYFSFATIYHLFILVVWILTSTLSILYEIPPLLKERFSFDDGILLSSNAIIFTVLLVPLLAFYERTKFTLFLTRLENFEEKLNVTTRTQVPELKLRKQHWCFIICTTLFCMHLFYNGYYKMEALRQQYGIKFDVSILIAANTILRGSLAFFTLATLALMWRVLNSILCHYSCHLIKDIKSCHWVSQRSLSQHFIAWQKLADLHEEMGIAMGYTFCSLCMLLYLNCLPVLFYGASTIADLDFSPLFLSLFMLILISLFIDCGHSSLSMLCKGVQRCLTDLLDDNKTSGLENEIQQFIKGIVDIRPEITLGDFFKVNRSANIALYSSVITYFIVILQFKGDSQEHVALKESKLEAIPPYL